MLLRGVLAMMLMGVPACGDDEVAGPCDSCEELPPDFREPWHVLNNLQKAYNDRNVTRYDELLDADFTFFFADQELGGNIPEQWGRAEELATATAMFSSTQIGNFPRARSIEVDILFEGQTQWVEVVPGSAPEEIWLVTTLSYALRIEVEPDHTLMSPNGAKSQFVVRNAGTADAPRWRLVEWRDIGVPVDVPPGSRFPASVDEITWSQWKAAYVP